MLSASGHAECVGDHCGAVIIEERSASARPVAAATHEKRNLNGIVGEWPDFDWFVVPQNGMYLSAIHLPMIAQGGVRRAIG